MCRAAYKRAALSLDCVNRVGVSKTKIDRVKEYRG
jgi:hypothetical protein